MAMIYYLKVRDRENWDDNQPESLRNISPMQINLDYGTLECKETSNG